MRRLELVLERWLAAGHDVRGAPGPQERAVGARAPGVEWAEVERLAKRQPLGDERVERPPADERAMRVPGVRSELLVAEEHVRDAKGSRKNSVLQVSAAARWCNSSRRETRVA